MSLGDGRPWCGICERFHEPNVCVGRITFSPYPASPLERLEEKLDRIIELLEALDSAKEES